MPKKKLKRTLHFLSLHFSYLKNCSKNNFLRIKKNLEQNMFFEVKSESL
jgi:hypothetical protein